MKPSLFLITAAAAAGVMAESGQAGCYSPLNILTFQDFSVLCLPINFLVNPQGLSVLEVLYLAMRTTTVPPMTLYGPQENIVCITHDPGPNITFTADPHAGVGPVSAGTSVSFSFTLFGPDIGSICIFTEGTGTNKSAADPVTLAHATELIYDLIANPFAACKSCARVPLRFPNVTDATNAGGILKVNFRSNDKCTGNCVGSHSSFANSTNNTASSNAGRPAVPNASSGWWSAVSLLLLPVLACALDIL